MRGDYSCTLDAKGRIIFPAKLREELGESFVIFRGFDNCITVYKNQDWQTFEEKLSALGSEGLELQRYYSVNFLCEPDGQGRMMIPDSLRNHAGLQTGKDQVIIIGMQNKAEIWDKARWDAYNAGVEKMDLRSMQKALGL